MNSNAIKSVFIICSQYEYKEPSYISGGFLTREEAKRKASEQYKWDMDNGNDTYGANMYFILEIPIGTSSYERKDKEHIAVEDTYGMRTGMFVPEPYILNFVLPDEEDSSDEEEFMPNPIDNDIILNGVKFPDINLFL